MLIGCSFFLGKICRNRKIQMPFTSLNNDCECSERCGDLNSHQKGNFQLFGKVDLICLYKFGNCKND